MANQQINNQRQFKTNLARSTYTAQVHIWTDNLFGRFVNTGEFRRRLVVYHMRCFGHIMTRILILKCINKEFDLKLSKVKPFGSNFRESKQNH